MSSKRAKFNYNECRDVMLNALVTTLKQEAARLREFADKLYADAKGALGAGTIGGIGVQVLPWHPEITISFGCDNDVSEHYFRPADWKGANFIRTIQSQAKESCAPAMEYLTKVYPESGGTPGQEINHLVQLASADALLNPKVAKVLQGCRLPANVVSDKIPYGHFKYVVVDEDCVLKSNYCEMLIAMRVAKRLLGRTIE